MSDEDVPVQGIIWIIRWSRNEDDLVGLLIAKPKLSQVVVLSIGRAHVVLGTNTGHSVDNRR
jgi:hypothetical protein